MVSSHTGNHSVVNSIGDNVLHDISFSFPTCILGTSHSQGFMQDFFVYSCQEFIFHKFDKSISELICSVGFFFPSSSENQTPSLILSSCMQKYFPLFILSLLLIIIFETHYATRRVKSSFSTHVCHNFWAV